MKEKAEPPPPPRRNLTSISNSTSSEVYLQFINFTLHPLSSLMYVSACTNVHTITIHQTAKKSVKFHIVFIKFSYFHSHSFFTQKTAITAATTTPPEAPQSNGVAVDVSINNNNNSSSNDKSPDIKGDKNTTISSVETKVVTKDKEQSINSPAEVKEKVSGMT